MPGIQGLPKHILTRVFWEAGALVKSSKGQLTRKHTNRVSYRGLGQEQLLCPASSGLRLLPSELAASHQPILHLCKWSVAVPL